MSIPHSTSSHRERSRCLRGYWRPDDRAATSQSALEICICMQVSLGEVPYIAADSDKIARRKGATPAMLSFVRNADRRRGRSAALFQAPLFC